MADIEAKVKEIIVNTKYANEEVGKLCVDTFRLFADDGRLISKFGPNGRQPLREFRLEQIGTGDDVQLSASRDVARSLSSKRQQLIEAKKTLDDLEAKVSAYKLQHNGELPQQDEAAGDAAPGVVIGRGQGHCLQQVALGARRITHADAGEGRLDAGVHAAREGGQDRLPEGQGFTVALLVPKEDGQIVGRVQVIRGNGQNRAVGNLRLISITGLLSAHGLTEAGRELSLGGHSLRHCQRPW